MNYLCRLLFAGLFGCALLSTGCRTYEHQEWDRRPNIVLIIADDLGYGDVGFLNPNSKIRTPHLDRLAREGMVFTDAHTVGGVCTPARYALLTGRYGWRTRLPSGVLDGYAPRLIEEGRLTLPEMLRQQGYATATIGKWHLGMTFGLKDPPPDPASLTSEDYGELVDFTKPVTGGPNAVGFDYFFGVPSSIDISPYVVMENERVFVPATIPIRGGRGMLAFRPGLAAPGFQHVDIMPLTVTKTREYLEGRAKEKDRPFFLFLPNTAVHNPIVPSPEFAGTSAAGPYGDFVQEVDGAAGSLMRDLKELGLDRNTLVLFMSDNGPAPLTVPLREEFGHDSAAGLRGLKGTLYEGGHRLPFVAHWPRRIPAGVRSAELIGMQDVMATVAALTGYTLPVSAAEDSVSFLPLLRGERSAKSARDSIVFHASNGKLAIREGPLKLIPGDKPELYDVIVDRTEETNLATQSEAEVARLTALLEQIRDAGQQ